MALKELNLNLYDLAPCVLGEPNVGDYVRPSLGIPEGHDDLIAMLKTNEGKKRNMPLNDLRDELVRMSKHEDKKDDNLFMRLYMIMVMGFINAPNTTGRVNLNYLGTFLTGKEYMLCDHIVDTLVDGVTNWRNEMEAKGMPKQKTMQENMLLPIVSNLLYVWYCIYLQIFCIMSNDIIWFPYRSLLLTWQSLTAMILILHYQVIHAMRT